jgi:hypothetical protein
MHGHCHARHDISRCRRPRGYHLPAARSLGPAGMDHPHTSPPGPQWRRPPRMGHGSGPAGRRHRHANPTRIYPGACRSTDRHGRRMTRGAAGRLIRRSALRPSERLILLALLDRADNATCDIRWSPSLTRLQAETGLSRTTICDALRHLEMHGWVSRDERTPGQVPGHHGTGKGYGRTRYRLLPGAIQSCDCPPRSRPVPDSPVAALSPAPDSPVGGLSDSPDDIAISPGQRPNEYKGSNERIDRERVGSRPYTDQWLVRWPPRPGWDRWPAGSIGEHANQAPYGPPRLNRFRQPRTSARDGYLVAA